MEDSPGLRRGRGRPRDTSIDVRALEATRQLLVERGFEATTIQAVAERSGLHVSALYRRWPSRIEMIREATFPGLSTMSVEPTGDLRRDLRRFLRAYLAIIGTPAARAAAGGLIAHRRDTTEPPPEVYARVSARPQFRAILKAADPALVDPAVDPEDAFDMILGAVLTRIHLQNAAISVRPLERSVDLILRMLRPEGR